MRAGKTILVGLLLVWMTVGFSLNAIAQNNSEKGKEIPEIFQLNPSLGFDKAAIKDWAEENSWEKANSLIKESHRRGIIEDYYNSYFLTFYTPVVSWVEANYLGDQRFWSESRIEKRYDSTRSWPAYDADFMVHIRTTEESGVKKENLRFILTGYSERENKRWDPKKISGRTIEEKRIFGTKVYKRIFDLNFTFKRGHHPSFTEDWVLYIIRKDKLIRKEFRWKSQKGYCEGVTELDLSATGITNLSPLTKCNGLKRLDLSSNILTKSDPSLDIVPLTKLANLQELDLSFTDIENFTMLARLEGLKKLTLNVDENTNLSPLAELSSLRKLVISYSDISDLSPIAKLQNLKELSFLLSQVKNSSQLSELKGLRTLNLVGNELTDVTPLSSLKNLTELNLNSNKITDVTPLSNLKNLQKLSLGANEINDISALEDLQKLDFLQLSNNNITNLEALVENSGLGKGDKIYIKNNDLVLTEDSEDMQDIQVLLDRGVKVEYKNKQ